MNNLETDPVIDPQAQADLDEVCRLLSEPRRVIDPQLLERIRERSDDATRQVFDKYGTVEWFVDLIREGRDEE
jgi:hypothetical protein